jgi:hypothetical protein
MNSAEIGKIGGIANLILRRGSLSSIPLLGHASECTAASVNVAIFAKAWGETGGTREDKEIRVRLGNSLSTALTQAVNADSVFPQRYVDNEGL